MNRILVLGDLHAPYHHRDAFAFMEGLADVYDINRVIHIGDEVDWASQNYHEKIPGLHSPAAELKLVRKNMQRLYELFPDMDVIDSNHGNLPARKAQTIGFPIEFLRDKNEIYDIPDGWRYHFDLTIKLGNGEKVYIVHGKTGNVIQLSKTIGSHAIQGHYHSKMGVTYYGTPERMMWGAQTGCLVNEKSLAMAYSKNSNAKPMLGSLIIIDNSPAIIPMRLKKSGRWDNNI